MYTKKKDSQPFSQTQKVAIVGFLLCLIGGVWFAASGRAATWLSLTLSTNPDLERGLIAHWTFDSAAVDRSTSTAEIRDRVASYHLNWQNHATTTALGVLGQAIQLDGVDDYLGTTNLGSSVYTIALWVNFSTSSLSKNLVTLNGTEYISTNGSGNATATYQTAGTIVTYVDGSAASVNIPRPGEWHHIVVTCTAARNASTFEIGRFGSSYAGFSVDDVRVYSRALSASEVSRLYGLGATTRMGVTLDTNADLQNGLAGHWTFDGVDMGAGTTSEQLRYLDRVGTGRYGESFGDMFGSEGEALGSGSKAWDLTYYGQYIYVAGYGVPTSTNCNYIEKRGMSDGVLVSDFGLGGVATSSGQVFTEIKNDGTYLYTVGRGWDDNWRIEKRYMSTGALVAGFGTNGVVTGASTSFVPEAAVLDGTNLYVAGHDDSGGYHWRIEKRLMSTGALVAGFGTSGVVTGTLGYVYDMISDGTNLYLTGYDSTWSDTRTEKRLMSTGALVAGFGTGGAATTTDGTMGTSITSDGTNLYIGGYGCEGGCTYASFWMLEKRSMSTGALVAAFDSDGIILPGSYGEVWGIENDGTYLYAAGCPTYPCAANWKIEKRLLSDGSFVSGFGSSGVVTDTGGYGDRVDITKIGSYLYVTGEKNWAAGLRTTKRLASNGTLVATGTKQVEGAIGQGIKPAGAFSIGSSTGPSNIQTVAFWIKVDEEPTSTEPLMQLTTKAYVSLLNTGKATTTGFTSPVLYVNGVATTTLPRKGTWAHIVAISTTGTTTSNLTLCRTPAVSACSDISFDDLRLYTRALSANEVVRLYGLGATTHVGVTLDTDPVLESDLIGHWSFDGPDTERVATSGELSFLDTSTGGRHIVPSSIDAFGTGGVVTSTGGKQVYQAVQDDTYLYIAGSDDSSNMRLEKRLKSDGSLVAGFGTNGVVTSAGGIYTTITRDATNLYLGGRDGSSNWYLEKRLMSTGALVTAFDGDGIFSTTTVYMTPSAMATDTSYIYIQGYSGTQNYRIERRNITTGALVAGFGTNGVVTVNAFYIETQDMWGDATYLYSAIYDTYYLDTNWVERRLKTTGALAAGFGSGGKATTSTVQGNSIKSDGTNLYVFGSTKNVTGAATVKFLVSNGTRVTSFGYMGDATSTNDYCRGGKASDRDATYLYLASEVGWCIEKRSLSTGGLVGEFGGSGVAANGSGGGYAPKDILVDAAYLYTVGDNGTDWRIERRLNTTGLPEASIPFASTTEGVIGQALSLRRELTVGTGPSNVRSVAFWAKVATPTQQLMQVSGSDYVSVSNGAISVAGFSPATVYVNGSQTTTLPINEWAHIVVTTSNAVNATALKVCKTPSGTCNASFDDLRLYSRELSAPDIARLRGLGV